MNDLYAEVLVKRQSTGREPLIKAGLLAAAVISALSGLFVFAPLILVTVAVGVGCFFIFPRLHLEYEYLFVNGDLDIDMILNQAKRKSVKSFHLEQVDIIAPENSHRLDYYRQNTAMKLLDYSSGDPSHKRYMMIVREENQGACKVLLEPDEEMTAVLKQAAPGKVYTD